MVIAPALTAATPVGASTIWFFFVYFFTSFRKVVFPVPAFPVRKMLLSVFSTMKRAISSSLFCDISVIFLLSVYCHESLRPGLEGVVCQEHRLLSECDVARVGVQVLPLSCPLVRDEVADGLNLFVVALFGAWEHEGGA